MELIPGTAGGSGPTRRMVLGAAAAAAAGAALAPLGCAGRSPISGRIVGGHDTRGHWLREGAPSWPVASRETCRVAIVGAGVAGLAAAWRLARAGVHDAIVLELEDGPGGTACAGANAVSPYPWGAHYLPIPTREQSTLCRFLEEIGVVRGYDDAGRALPAEAHLCRAPQERLFYRGAWMEGLYLRDGASGADLDELTRFQAEAAALGARRDSEGRRAFALPVARSSADAALRGLDATSMAAWLDARGFRSERLRWYVEYACRDDYGCLLPHTSAWAGLHYFASRIAVAGDEAAEFLTWPEGNAFLTRHLAAAAEGRIRAGAVVTTIVPDGDGAVVRYLDAAAGATRELRADRVICAVPRFIARRLVPALAGETGGFRYSPWVVANLTLDGPPAARGFPLAWDNVRYDSESLGYVVATHQSDRPGRGSVWTWYRPFCGPDVAAERARVLTTPWEGWRDAVLADLRPAHADLETHVTTLDVWRWGHGMVRPEPGFLWGAAREAAARPCGPVHFAGADLGGLPLFEEAQWQGVRAAEEACAGLGIAVESWL